MEKGQLDFLCLTEAWHQGYCALSEAHPPGYSYLEAARKAGHGGGSAVIHRQDLELSLIYLPTTSSYECLAFKCKPCFSHDCCPHLPALKSQPCFRPRNVYSHNPLYHLCQYHNPGRSKHACWHPIILFHNQFPSAARHPQPTTTCWYPIMLQGKHTFWTSLTPPQSATYDSGVKWEVWSEPIADGFLSHSSLVQVYHLLPDIFWQLFGLVHGGTESGELETDL